VTWKEWGIKVLGLGLKGGLKDCKAFGEVQFIIVGVEGGFDFCNEKFYAETSMTLELVRVGPLYATFDFEEFTEKLWDIETFKKFKEWLERSEGRKENKQKKD
jgi:hypothetical protein